MYEHNLDFIGIEFWSCEARGVSRPSSTRSYVLVLTHGGWQYVVIKRSKLFGVAARERRTKLIDMKRNKTGKGQTLRAAKLGNIGRHKRCVLEIQRF